jgi:hypothetical protein
MDLQKLIKFLKNNKWIITIFIIALLIRIIFVYVYPIKWWDETIYSNLGHDLSANPLGYSLRDKGWGDLMPMSAWPKIGFRAPLLPYSLAALYFLKLAFLTDLLIPLIGALTVLLVYFFGKNLFNKNVGLISAGFLSFLPLHVLYSGRILTDVYSTFFIVLTLFAFWKGFEKGSKKYKIFFGIFFALAVLTRYNMVWVIPVFLVYFLIRDKNLKFLKDKYLWYSIIAFFIVMTPLFIYGYFEYRNIFGMFLHAKQASTYWGGNQDWTFFFTNWWSIFSIVGIIFIASIGYILYKKEFVKKEIYYLLIFIFVFFGFSLIIGHKEERYILPIAPILCLISGFFIDKFKSKIKILFVIGIMIFLIFANFLLFYHDFTNYHNVNSQCFYETVNYLKSINGDITVVNENVPVFYYYTGKRSEYYIQISESTFSNFKLKNNNTYFVFTKSGSGLNSLEFTQLKNILNNSYTLKFNCSLDPEHNFIYS